MNKATNQNLNGEIVTLEQAAKRVNLGISTVRIKADECGAALKIGRSYRINIQKLLDYLFSMEKAPTKKTKIPVNVVDTPSVDFHYSEKLTSGKNTITTIRIDEGLMENIKIYSEIECMSQTCFINQLLKAGFKSYFKEKDETN